MHNIYIADFQRCRAGMSSYSKEAKRVIQISNANSSYLYSHRPRPSSVPLRPRRRATLPSRHVPEIRLELPLRPLGFTQHSQSRRVDAVSLRFLSWGLNFALDYAVLALATLLLFLALFLLTLNFSSFLVVTLTLVGKFLVLGCDLFFANCCVTTSAGTAVTSVYVFISQSSRIQHTSAQR